MTGTYYRVRTPNVDGLTMLARILYGIAIAVAIDRFPDRRGINPHHWPCSAYPQLCTTCGTCDPRVGARARHRCES